MDAHVAKKILQAYRLGFRRIGTPGHGYRNWVFPVDLTSGGRINIIIYKPEPDSLARIRRTNAIGNFVAVQGYPARQTFDARILCLKNARGQRYTALYSYLPGQTIAWEAYTMEHLKALGAAMGQLHHILENYSGDLPNSIDELEMLQTTMQRYFAEPGVRRALATKLRLAPPQLDFGAFFDACRKLPHQALHLDLVRGNVLFTGKQVSGVIDFEKAARGPRLLDIARTLAFLLVDCKYKPAYKIHKYFLRSGYIKRARQQAVDAALLESAVNFYLFHDFYKFLHHNPYESLPANEHFVRTRQRLMKQRLLTKENY